MGRHASPAPAPADPDGADDGRLPRAVARHVPRLTLAVVAAATTTLAVAWTGNPWSTAAVAGGLVAVVVLAAAWLASTVPPPPASADPPEQSWPGTRSPDSAPGAGPDPVQ